MESYEELFRRLEADKQAFQKKVAIDVNLDDSKVRASILDQTQKYMEWGYVAAKAATTARRMKYEFEEEVAPKCRRWAEDKLRDEGKKTTVKAIDDTAASFADYKAARDAYLAAEEFAALTKHVVEAMRHRLAMVQSLNSREKSELDNTN